MSDPRSNDSSAVPVLSRGLGLLGISIGVAELAVPNLLARLIGVEPGRRTAIALRAMGAREILSSVPVAVQPHRPLALWGRVIGDVMDLAMLAIAAGRKRSRKGRLAVTAGVILGATAADAYAAYRTHARYRSFNRPVISAVTINRPPSEVYAFYRKLERLPDFMDWLESVEQIDGRRSHWVAKLPIGGKVEWDAEIVDDRPGEVIEWRTVDGSKVKMRGRVLFTTAPGSQATEVRVEMSVGFTGVDPSNYFAAMFARPQIKGDLRRLKQVLETGEVIESDASLYRLPHPAQPPSDQPEAGRKEIRVQPSYRRDELVPPEEVIVEEEIVIVPEEVRP